MGGKGWITKIEKKVVLIMTEDYYPYIKNFFKKWARIYDVVIFLLAGVRTKTVAMTGASKAATILDVATGTGKQAFAYAKNGNAITGIDLSEDMLKIARKNNKYENLKLEIGDAAALVFKDNQFDVTSVSFALHDMPPEIREKVLGEMVRVTRPGGAIMVVDYALPKNGLIKFLAYNFIRSFESKYYTEFIKNDFPALLAKTGVRIQAERGVLFGAGRIIKGVKAA
ncbi:MAG: class I SAM-dependent methyltransferase [Dehalococcoidales bacterium]